ncbi:MAG: glutathione S-transferase family protein [Rhizobiaceae bacterium]|nr:glutathione S-transferase family protein [Rhizobiaceae bacterium]
MSFTLYDYALSGNCYKIRLFANILNIDYERIAVEFYPGADHRSEKMLAISPAGTLPILTTDDIVLSETSAMLFWIARNYDAPDHWWPEQDLTAQANILQWMGFSSDLTATIGQGRLHALFQTPIDKDKMIKGGRAALRKIEAHLSEQSFDGCSFLTGNKPTIADIACFPYVALSPDVGANIGFDHDDYPAIRNWIYAMKSLDGFIPMPGIYAMHELKDHEIDYGSQKSAKAGASK